MANLAYKRVTTYVNAHSTTVDAETLYYYGYDQVGNVVFVSEDTDSSTSKEFVFHQDAFGNELNTGVYASNSWTTAAARTTRITEHHTGKDLDPFTGLYYFSARWYDPMVGRFVGREPLLEDVGSLGQLKFAPSTLNQYQLSANNPVLFTDPNGEFLVWGCGIGGFIGAIGGIFSGGLFSAVACCPGDSACAKQNLLFSAILGGISGCLAGGFLGITSEGLLLGILGERYASAIAALITGTLCPPDCG